MDLNDDETLIFKTSPSWKSQFGKHVMLVIGSILVGAVVGLIADVGIGIAAGVVIALVVFGLLWAERSRTTYMVTSQRIQVREGFLSKEVQQTRLDRIQNVTLDQSVAERLLRIGTVDYDTAGDDGSRFRMIGVSNPDGLVRLVDRTQRDAFDAERDRNARAEAEADARVRGRSGDGL
ncbi:PH domain-containing protein [Patulibacter minatonensis]|uniref:PH domain-containing protein n=1 Tax=Patulibacter minatonensis TaxID=298163 RepID=UPI00047C23A4|nr:PH domain-containing protein [Patulibacter minatonensis]